MVSQLMSAIGTKRTLPSALQCPLLGVKRTCLFAAQMSAYDPERTCSDCGSMFAFGVKADINSGTTPALGSYEGGGYERRQDEGR